MYLLQGGVVPLPRWTLYFRFFELLFAIVVLALTAYALSEHGGGPLRPALIPLLIVAVLTLLLVLPLTTPLLLAQRRVFDPRAALALDGAAALFWLATFVVMASYDHAFLGFGSGAGGGYKAKRAADALPEDLLRRAYGTSVSYADCGRCRAVVRVGLAAAWFAALEFLLFLCSTLLFLYFYHRHMLDMPIHSRHHSRFGAGTEAGTSTGTGAGASPTAPDQHFAGLEEHPMHSMPGRSSPTAGGEAGLASSNSAGAGSGSAAGRPDVPYPNQRPRDHGGASSAGAGSGGEGANMF